HRLLITDGVEERGQGIGYLSYVACFEWLDPGGELRDEPRENPQTEMIRGGDPRCLEHPAAHQPAHRTPRRVVVALDDPRRRHRGAGEGQALGARVEQARAPGAGLARDP